MGQEPSYSLKQAAKQYGFSFVALSRGAVYEAGKTYWCNYWSRWYQVTDVKYQKAGRNQELVSVTIRWQNGELATHRTPLHPEWDWELRWPQNRQPQFSIENR